MTDHSGPKSAQQVIKNLHNFNRKERDHLMKFALSDSPSYPRISKDLWRAIRPKNAKTKRPNPEQMFVGMDYHLNWLYAALVLSNEYEQQGIRNQPNAWPADIPAEKGSFPIQGNQQDVDLLVAFQNSDKELHLILIEAKLDTGWKSEQFLSKVQRIDAIKQVVDDFEPELKTKWQFLLASPSLSGPKREAFAPESLRKQPDWVTEDSGNGNIVPHRQFGPSKLFHVKRKDDAPGSPWEVIPVNLRGSQSK